MIAFFLRPKHYPQGSDDRDPQHLGGGTCRRVVEHGGEFSLLSSRRERRSLAGPSPHSSSRGGMWGHADFLPETALEGLAGGIGGRTCESVRDDRFRHQ